MSKFAIAGIQMEAIKGDNLERMTRHIAGVMRRYPWVQMIMFSELLAFGAAPGAAQPMPGPAENHFCSLAKKYNIWLLPGSMYEIDGDKIYNTAPVINPDGEVIVRHRKLFPFEPYESGINSGTQHTVFDIPDVGCFGVSICYDMWFPETVRALTFLGAEVILHPTLTDSLDRKLELPISQTNAITNQCYFIDMNSCGELGNGQSVVVGPEGDIIHQSGTQQETVPIIINLERVRYTRETGVLSLGQPLKSFRDSEISYPQYQPEARSDMLGRLGVLEKMKQIPPD